MKHILVSLKDIKSGVFTPPIPFRSVGEARRAYMEAILKDPMLSKYPDDFELYHVGDWDNETGEIASYGDEYLFVCNIDELAKQINLTATVVKEDSGDTAGGFPVSETVAQGDQVANQEVAEQEQERRFCLGGNKK